MPTFRTILPLFILLSVLALTGLKAEAQVDLVENGSFETGDFAGWTREELSPGSSDWFVYSGTLSPLGSQPILPPPVGSFAAVTDQTDPSSNILYQDIEIPAGATVTCSAIVYYENRSQGGFVIGDGLSTSSPNQQYRIDIMDPAAPAFDTGAGVLLNIFQTLPGDPNSLGYTTIDFDLTPFAGSTVRLRAAVAITANILNGSIDAVSCLEDLGPRPIPTLGEWGLIAMAGILGLAGLLYAGRRKAAA